MRAAARQVDLPLQRTNSSSTPPADNDVPAVEVLVAYLAMKDFCEKHLADADGEATKVFLAVWYQTHGFGKEADAIGGRRLTDRTGLHHNTVEDRATALHNRGVIQREKVVLGYRGEKPFFGRSVYRVPISAAVRAKAEWIRAYRKNKPGDEDTGGGALRGSAPVGGAVAHSELTHSEENVQATVRRPPSATAFCRQPPDERPPKLASARALCSEDEAATLTKLLNEAADKARQRGLPFRACGPVPNTQTSVNILNEVRRRNPDATPEEIHAYLVRRVFLDEPTPARSWNKWEVVVKAIGRDYPAAVPRSGSRVLEPAADASKVEELRDHLLRCAEALRSRPELVEVCHALDGLAADANTQYRDLQALEEKLTDLEAKALAIVRESITDEQQARLRAEVEPQLRPFRSRMTVEQIRLLERHYLDRHVQEKAGLPRLSLFYFK